MSDVSKTNGALATEAIPLVHVGTIVKFGTIICCSNHYVPVIVFTIVIGGMTAHAIIPINHESS